MPSRPSVLICSALAAFCQLAQAHAPAHAFAFGAPGKASEATRTVEVTLGDIYFAPKVLQVKAGETVRFVLKNEGKLVHEFNLGDAQMHAQHQREMLEMQNAGALGESAQHANMASMDHGVEMSHGEANQAVGMSHDDPNSVLVQPGQTGELVWTFAHASGLQFACNVPGHYQAGMVGEIRID
jgi:uncharacterized cupredoxin-like copper-binding protein